MINNVSQKVTIMCEYSLEVLANEHTKLVDEVTMQAPPFLYIDIELPPTKRQIHDTIAGD